MNQPLIYLDAEGPRRFAAPHAPARANSPAPARERRADAGAEPLVPPLWEPGLQRG